MHLIPVNRIHADNRRKAEPSREQGSGGGGAIARIGGAGPLRNPAIIAGLILYTRAQVNSPNLRRSEDRALNGLPRTRVQRHR
jgi:hypothetical protein